MRFAGQRFRMGRYTEGDRKSPSGYIPDMNYRYQAQGLPPSMNNIPEFNVARIAKTGEPTHGEPEFNIGNFSEPDFRV